MTWFGRAILDMIKCQNERQNPISFCRCTEKQIVSWKNVLKIVRCKVKKCLLGPYLSLQYEPLIQLRHYSKKLNLNSQIDRGKRLYQITDVVNG